MPLLQFFVSPEPGKLTHCGAERCPGHGAEPLRARSGARGSPVNHPGLRLLPFLVGLDSGRPAPLPVPLNRAERRLQVAFAA